MTTVCWKTEWLANAQRFGSLPAVNDRYGSISYSDVFDAAAGVAAALMRPAEGPDRGAKSPPGENNRQVVASMVANSRHAVAASYGICLAGITEAPINPALSREDIEHCLTLAGVTRVLTTRDNLDRLAGFGVEVLAVEDMAPIPFETLPAMPVDLASWARVMFTSGTTSKPKGIVHSHGGRWTGNVLMRSTLPVAPKPGNAVLLMTPFGHGTSLLTQAFLDGGATVHLVDGIREDAVMQALTGGEVDHIFAPPAVLGKLVSMLEGRKIDGIRAIFCGTSPLLPEQYRKAREIFGPVIRITYGKTEIFNPITVLTPPETDNWFASEGAADSVCVGWPASGVEVVIESHDDAGLDGSEDIFNNSAGDESDTGVAVGPVLLRARHQLVATLIEDRVEPHPPEAFHRTGDLGYLDAEGRLHLVGREADVIKTGGYRVTPDEVESRLRPVLDQGEIVVIGLPSDTWGEIITLVAAGVRDDWREQLKPHIAAMTGYKRPRLFVDLPEIERNALGKISRRRILETVLRGNTLVDGRYPELTPRVMAGVTQGDPG